MYFYVFLGVFRHVAQKQISQQKSLETLTHQGFQGFLVGALQGIRTPDLLVRSQTLYPTELRAQKYITDLIHTYVNTINI